MFQLLCCICIILLIGNISAIWSNGEEGKFIFTLLSVMAVICLLVLFPRAVLKDNGFVYNSDEKKWEEPEAEELLPCKEVEEVVE